MIKAQKKESEPRARSLLDTTIGMESSKGIRKSRRLSGSSNS